eukprot:TRINITY_DN2131_c0_g1_i1.p1 TRINITY_DN2131_c0_g1~~TRINITY_DN2131_c0_g1_i1.p1  ORF type:complete len:193 (-),score=33.83 TRINITY_DN2131_c0_g1_i1:380-958(-)
MGFFFFSSRRRHTRCREVSWARRCVQETVSTQSTWDGRGLLKLNQESGVPINSDLKIARIKNGVLIIKQKTLSEKYRQHCIMEKSVSNSCARYLEEFLLGIQEALAIAKEIEHTNQSTSYKSRKQYCCYFLLDTSFLYQSFIVFFSDGEDAYPPNQMEALVNMKNIGQEIVLFTITCESCIVIKRNVSSPFG